MGVVFHHAHHHTVKITSKKIEELGWEKKPTLSLFLGYYIIWLLPIWEFKKPDGLVLNLDGLVLKIDKEVETTHSTFPFKPKDFCKNIIIKLVNHWKEIIKKM